MPQATFTFRVDEDIKNTFTQLAQENDRSASQLLRDFMRQYINKSKEQDAYQAWLSAKVEQRIQEADAGLFLSNEEVEERAEKFRNELIAKA